MDIQDLILKIKKSASQFIKNIYQTFIHSGRYLINKRLYLGVESVL